MADNSDRIPLGPHPQLHWQHTETHLGRIKDKDTKIANLKK